MDTSKEPDKKPDEGVLLESNTEVHEQEDDSISGDKPDTSLISFADEDASDRFISSLSTDKMGPEVHDIDVSMLVPKLTGLEMSDAQSHASGDGRSLETGLKKSIEESQPDVSASSSEQCIGGARPKKSNTSISTKPDVQFCASGDDRSLEAGLQESQPDVSPGSSEQYIGGACPKESNTSVSTKPDAQSHASGDDRSLETGLKQSIEESQPDVSASSSEQCIGGARPKESNTGVSTNPGQEDVPKKYYAVAFPSADLIQEDNPLIYDHKTDAMLAIRLFPGSRFREFSSRKEAYEYALAPFPSEAAPSFRVDGKKTLYKSMNSQEMVEMRRSIKSGNEAMFLERVWANPRCLVSHCDGPTIMQEGTRYNALHIAAKSGQTGMFLSILYVIQDNRFLSTLYPEDKPSMTEVRIKRLVDMYLNMPDKAMSDTPLHIACKFGHESIVCIILSYSQCHSQLRNRDGYCAKDIVCQHHECNSGDHKERMLAVFEELFYVPILRDDVHNFVGQPCNGSTVLVATTSNALKNRSSATYCAFAGPGSLGQVTGFCTLLKTKKFIGEKDVQKFVFDSKAETLLEICLADPKKGIERVGRRLSKDFSIGWFEFWSILDGWFDLSSAEGLECLNNHLKKQDDQINVKQGEPPAFIDLIINFTDEFVQKIPRLAVCKSQLFFFHQLQSLVAHMDCFTKYSYSNETEIADIHEEIGHMLYLKLTDDNHSNLENFQSLKFFLLTQFTCVGCFQKLKWKMFACILRFAFYFQSCSAVFAKEPLCTCDYTKVDDSYVYSSRSCYYAVVSLRQELTNDLVQKFETSPGTPSEKSVEQQYMLFPVLDGRLSLNFQATRNGDGFLVENESTPDQNLEQLDGQFRAFQGFFITSIDGFNFVFRSLMLKYEDKVPFKELRSFFDVFWEAMKYFKPICEVNYYQDYHLLFIHDAIASCLATKMLTVPSETVLRWKSYFRDNAFVYKNFDLSEYGVTSTREWMHFLCVIKQFCYILDSNDYFPLCTCTFDTDRAQESVLPADCIELVTILKNLYLASYEFINAESLESSIDGGEFLTPPDSLANATNEVFVRGEVMSDADIDIFRALTDAGVLITRVQYPYIFKWKNLMESRMGPVLKAEDTRRNEHSSDL